MDDKPAIYNQRFPMMRMLIDDSIDFKDKTVVDMGCGYGDLCFHAARSGARYVVGVDSNSTIVHATLERARELLVYDEIMFMHYDLDTLWLEEDYDLAFCLSVLPYLTYPDRLLSWMATHAQISVIECQYQGDGPGRVRDSDQMREWLAEFWTSVTCLGGTLVKDREKIRHIWMCKNDA